MLQILNLTKTYAGGEPAVADLSLHIAPGDLFGFIGHNGAGKTTTLKAVAGILEFESGDIRIGGRSIREEPIACKQIMAYIPDNPDVYEFLSGIQYLNFVADIFSVDTRTRKQRIEKYAGAFELTSKLSNPISAYSHGTKQKLALIGAFLHEPKLLVLDEPFAGLDPKAAFTLKSMMRDLCATGGSIFFSTHVLEVAEKLCNKIAIIKNGKLVRSGDIEEVKGDESLETLFLELIDNEEE